MTLTPEEQVAIATDPVAFAQHYLGVTTWPLYERVLRAQGRAGARLMLVGCHSSAKTHAGSVGDLWHVARHPGGRVVCMGPTWTTIESVIWPETRELVRAQRGAIFPRDATDGLLQTSLTIPGFERRGILSMSTDRPERLRGIKGGHLRVRIEEINGLREHDWPEIEGMLAGGSPSVVAAQNPTNPRGPAFELCRPGSGWEVIRIAAWDLPNLATLPGVAEALERGASERAVEEAMVADLESLPDDEGGPLDEAPLPFLIRRRYVRDMFRKYGLGHPFWEARVAARFPEAGESALIHLAWLDLAKRPATDHHGLVTGGLDVAGPGKDETAATIVEHWTNPETERDELHVLDRASWPQGDCRGEAVAFFMRWKERLEVIHGDDGGVGHHFLSHLKDAGLSVQRHSFGARAEDADTYELARDQLSWEARERMERGEVYGLDDDETAGQAARVLWGTSSKGRIVTGAQIGPDGRRVSQKRGGASPDRWESFILAAHRGRSAAVYSGKILTVDRFDRLAAGLRSADTGWAGLRKTEW